MMADEVGWCKILEMGYDGGLPELPLEGGAGLSLRFVSQ